MEFVGCFGKEIVEFTPASSDDQRNGRNLVIIEREA
jgi:hypothetical protein